MQFAPVYVLPATFPSTHFVDPAMFIKKVSSDLSLATTDLSDSFRKFHIAFTMARQEIATRYKRSRVGAFWITIGMAVSITCVGFVFGSIYKVPVNDFLPYFAAGTILWGFITSSLVESCGVFVSSSGMILQIRMPYFVHVLRVHLRDMLLLAHNILILPLVFLILSYPVNACLLLAVPGFLLLLANISWMALVLAVLCARFRDVGQIVQNSIGVLYFVTPIMWQPNLLPGTTGQLLMDYNPFFHLVSIVREPLLGNFPSFYSWICSGIMGCAGWIFALLIFGRFRNRIPYWL